ncbi:MAG TPA: hypothetical protein VJ826_13445, partial [Candidatus Polarisedimenticolaceae bacterium]|nr:hypothetical protein [Candidatus Polarisedimenticolaceae bacterium]
MKTVRAAALLCLLLAGLATGAHAATGTCESLPGGPVELESTGGLIGPTGYASLGAAFADINNGSYTGAITIDVCGDAAEGVSAVLNASGVGGSSYTGVTISPAGGAAHTISGSIAGALVDLSGADGVVIDGLNASGNSLTLDNSSTGPASTIRFIGEATGNSIQNCTIKGSSTSVTSGTIVFATGASTGNNSNTINGNLITPSGANLPANAIYSAGTSAGIANTGIAITNNFVSDWFSATTASNGILVASNSAAWTITGNRFFQSATRTATTGATHRAIGIVTASGGGYTVGNNTIGFANGSGGGITTYTGAVAILYRGIEMTVAASPASSVQGNTVSGISLSTTSNSSTAPGVFAGISILGGSVNVGTSTGNTVGSSSATGAITVTSTVTGSLTDGIYATTGAAAGTLDIRNNSVGGITASSATAAIGFVVRGIETAGTGGVVTISGNTIGSTTAADSIQIGINGTTTAVTSFAGIQNAATGTPHSISNNTVQNCSANGSGASIFQGIINAGGSSTATVSGNSVIAGTLRGTGASQGIVNIAPVPTINLTSNTVRGMTLTAATGTFQGVANQGASTVAINIDDNKLGDANGGFISYAAATSGALIGIANTAGGTAGPALSIQRNDVRGISHAVTASHANDYINVSAGTFISQTIKDNTFTNISVNTTGTTTMIRVGAAVGISTPSTPGTRTVANNSIVGTFTKTGAGGSVIGFFINAG